MSRRAITAQKPFTMLVAHLAGGSDPSKGPSGNPVITRKTFTQQRLVAVSGRVQDSIQDGKNPGCGTQYGVMLTGDAVRSSVEITIASNTFTGKTWLHLGKYQLYVGEDFLIGGGVNDTAANLADLINTLPEFTASVPAGGVFTVEGLTGPSGNITQVSADGVDPGNFAFDPGTGIMGGAEPYIGPPLIS